MTNLNFNNTTTSANTSTSEKLKEKFSNWVSKVNAMDSDYFAVTPHEGKMYYLTGNYTSEVVSFCMLIDKGSGLEAKYIYNNEPHRIFTYRLYPRRSIGLLNEKMLNIMTDDLIAAYSDKSRIHVPKSLEELEQILINISHNQSHHLS